MNIEKIYQKFYEDNIKFSHFIDFVGINVSSDSDKPFLFKTYQHIGTSIERTDPFLSLLDRKDMIKNYLPIASSDIGRVQYDVRLANRQDDNMSEVFSFLKKYLSLSQQMSDSSLSEIDYFSKMNITDLPHYSMSSLYFIGLLWNEGNLSALKSHFLTRKVINPDHFSDGFWYDDNYFLDYICDSRNKPCQKIAEIASNILSLVEGHLWMFGLDTFSDSTAKYKIYLQNSKGFKLDELLYYLNECEELEAICDSLKSLCSWLKNHSELFLYGFAITVTTSGKYGFNLYFIPPPDVRGTT